jgi:predicted permease
MIRPGIRRYLRLLRGGSASAATQVDEEIRLHIELRTQQLIARGLSPAEARREAERRFGALEQTRKSLERSASKRDQRMNLQDRLHAWRQDAVYAWRGLVREPQFTAMIVVTLGLGIGANAAMFGIIDRLLLRGPEHLRNPDELVRLYMTENLPGEGDQTTWSHSYAQYLTQRQRTSVYSGVAAYMQSDGLIGRAPDTEIRRVGYATPNFFELLGTSTRIGRFFTQEEDLPPRGQRVAVLSYDLWQRSFEGQRSALGRDVVVNGDRYTIVGVTPKGFTGTHLQPVDVWLPMTIRAFTASPNWQTSWDTQFLRIIARRSAGTSSARLNEEATAAHRAAYPGKDVALRGARIHGEPLRVNSTAKESAEVAISRWLVGVSVIVLLIACANVANLLLVRVLRRRREIAVRVVLGVTRARLARLMLTESLILAGLSTLAGLAVAYWSGQFMRVLLLPDVEWTTPPIDRRVLLLSMLAALLTGLLIGLLPVLQATRTQLSSALKAGAREGGGRRAHSRHLLTALQAALSVVLLVGAGLFVKSLWKVHKLDLGIEPERVVVIALRHTAIGALTQDEQTRERARRMEIMDRAVERLRRMNGVTRVSSVVGTPFQNAFSIGLRVPSAKGGARSVNTNERVFTPLPELPGGGPYIAAVQADYFETVGTQLLRGRSFTQSDRAGSERVAIINHTMARTLWPDEDPLGHCLQIGEEQPAPCSRIVGVVEDARRSGLNDPPAMQYYIPLGQEAGLGFGGRHLLIRPSVDASELYKPIRAELQRLDPSILFVDVRTMQQSLDPQVRPWRLGATMFAAFGGLALLIAAIGVYSVIAYLVAQRLHEFGVRLALGAGTRHIRQLILTQGALLVFGGGAIGMVIALFAGRYVQDLLFNTSARDTTVFIVVAAMLVIVTILATAIPARRAGAVNPASALRSE